TAASEHELEDRFEDYLYAASADWLPQALPVRTNHGSLDAQRILVALAKVARTRHTDSWLADVIDRNHEHQFALAVAQMSTAIKANEKGDYAGGRLAAHRAKLLFRRDRNLAGELRAEAEEVYSNHLLYNGGQCTSLSRDLNTKLRLTTYRWLQ